MDKCVCQELEEGKEIILDDYNDDETSLKMGRRNGNYYLIAEAYNSVDAKIKYCPFCGRKLGED